MFRLKTLSVIAGVIAMLAVSVTPAFAEFEANKAAEKEANGEGSVTVLKAGEFVDEGSTVKCPASEIKAKWYIQTKGQIKYHQQNGEQEPTKKGPHLDWIIKTWGANCKANIGAEVNLSATISEGCRLQIVFEQALGSETEVKLNGGAGNECIIKAGPCTIRVPSANEKQLSSKNWKLGTTIASNNVLNQIEKSNITGITTLVQPKGLCILKSNEASELKGVELENVGENLV